jgi:hypothetical protein
VQTKGKLDIDFFKDINDKNRLWDFLAHADRTLYTVKKKQKNDFLLINDFRS